MTFIPTERRQKQWIMDHLNNGVCPEDKHEWYVAFYGRKLGAYAAWNDWGNPKKPGLACLEALEWLAGTNIKTLAEAWSRCRRPDWLIWCIIHMKPNTADFQKCRELCRALCKMEFKEPNIRGDLLSYRDLYGQTQYPRERLRQLEDHFRRSDRYYTTQERAAIVKLIKTTWGNPWRTA